MMGAIASMLYPASEMSGMKNSAARTPNQRRIRDTRNSWTTAATTFTVSWKPA